MNASIIYLGMGLLIGHVLALLVMPIIERYLDKREADRVDRGMIDWYSDCWYFAEKKAQAEKRLKTPWWVRD